MDSQSVTDRKATHPGPRIQVPGFVGRERELASLARAFASPTVVLVEGEAGIGKTRLVREFLASSATSALHAVTAMCPPFHQPLTLGPVTDALRQASDDVAGLGLSPLAGALRPLFPEWASALPPTPEPLGDATAARHRLFRALDELLRGLGVGVLVVEDVHWADEATLEFLLFLASRQPQRVSLLVTYRPDDLPVSSLLRRLSSRLSTGVTCVRFTLGPLDLAGTVALVSSMLDGEHVSEEFAGFLRAHTDGLPLAIEESVRLMGDRADLIRRGGEWVRRRHLDQIPVPPTVRDAVVERAGRLGSSQQAVLQAAAVLAEPEPEPVLVAVAGLSGDEAGRGMAGAVGCGLLADDEPNGQGLISFRHALAARAVYEAMPARLRRQMHLRAAGALEGLSPAPVPRLARHFREAGATADWVRYAEQAADLALASGDEATAATLLHDLVLRAGLPAQDVARLMGKIPLLALTEAEHCKDLAGALRAVADARDVEPDVEAEVRHQLGRLLVSMDDWNAAQAELERAVPHLTHDPAVAMRAMILLGCPIGQAEWPASRHLRWLHHAAEVTLPAGSADQLLLLVNRVTAFLMLGEEKGWAEAAGLSCKAATAGDWFQIARGHLNVADMAMLWGRYADSDRLLIKGLELAEARQYLRLRDDASATRAHLAWLTGAWDPLAERATALADDEDVLTLPRMKANLVAGLLAAASGAAAQAEKRLALALDGTRRHGAIHRSIEAAGALARLRLMEGHADQALTLTDGPMRVIAAKGIWLWATEVAPVRVQALASAGRTGDAANLVTAFARGLGGLTAPAPQAALALSRAILAEARDQHERAASLFGRAAAAWQALPRPYDSLLAREQRGRCLLAAGRDDEGLAVLGDVFRGLSGLGAPGDAGRVMRTLNEHGVLVRRPWRGGSRGYGDQLSPRELEVVRLVVEGRTNREIAQALCRSANTVSMQLKSAMRKLGVSSRTALAVRAVESADGNLLRGNGRATPAVNVQIHPSA